MGADERACAALIAFALLMGLCALWPPGAYLLACLMVLAAAHASSGAAAALGALSLCALLAGGGTLVTAASAGLGGAAAGALRSRGRLWAAPAFVVCAALIGLYAPAEYPGPLIPALAALAYVLAPEAWLCALGEALFRAPSRERALHSEATRALNALSAAFGELAAGVANLPDEQAVLLTMRERLCDACPHYARCWAGGGWERRAPLLPGAARRRLRGRGGGGRSAPGRAARLPPRGAAARGGARGGRQGALAPRRRQLRRGDVPPGRAHTRRRRPHARAAPGAAPPRCALGARARARARRARPAATRTSCARCRTGA